MVADLVSPDKVIKMNYTLTDATGNVLDSSQEEPMEYLQGHQNIIPGLENALEGLKPGDKKQVTVQPEQGYGNHNPELIFGLPLEQFGGEAPQPGMVVQLQSEEGVMMATIVKQEGEQIILDANHPLAGQVLNFEVEILGIREASPEELTHGHPHGPHGHHH
ncbi:peptidylprolyl isomerase [Vampirovibrio sp.]|uniref:FKBP-type peptidyl-prolyl cis-trans isomerase n=1 Tax=Vampirovibrio sp. TaxID=2717857 RepID=UPI003593F4E5